MGSAEKFAEQSRIRINVQEVFIRMSNCANGVVRSRGTGYEKESECSLDEVVEKFAWYVTNG